MLLVIALHISALEIYYSNTFISYYEIFAVDNCISHCLLNDEGEKQLRMYRFRS